MQRQSANSNLEWRQRREGRALAISKYEQRASGCAHWWLLSATVPGWHAEQKTWQMQVLNRL
jgi:hypothetical protein